LANGCKGSSGSYREKEKERKEEKKEMMSNDFTFLKFNSIILRSGINFIIYTYFIII
jgi:hypothetical protein